MPKARLHFEGDNTGIEKEARLYSLTQEVEDKLDSISSIETTLQGEIDDLQDQINQVASRGRYLTTWDCTTGLPDTNPTTDPYTYRPGDYYIVGAVGGTNYRPHGSEYHVGVASQTLETQAVSVNDLYIYDGTQWTLQRTGASVYAVWGSITGNLQAQTDLQSALDAKANKTDVLEKTNTTSYTPTADYHPATKKYADDNDTFIGAIAPTDNVVEGRLWYDTAVDVLKVYNGSQWVPTGKTYTAGQNIQISASDVISATDTTYNAGDNITIEDICTTESDMKGPAPDGFHVPLNTEWKAVRDIRVALGGGSSVNFGIALKLPFAGNRNYSSAGAGSLGIEGNYWSSSRHSADFAYRLYFDLSALSPQSYNSCAYGYSVRCFKNSPTVPTSSWTKLYGTSIEAGGIFWSSTDGLISLSSDGNTWITIADKNLGATTVWNSGDTLSEANCGYYYQRGNNYSFPFTGGVTTSSTQVDASTYGPGNYYSSSTFITRSSSPYSWDTTDNGNLWGGVTQGTWQDCIHNVISATDTTYSATDFDIKDLTDSTGLRTTWNSKQDALTIQTAYTSKGSATKVPQISTNTLGQVTGVTEVDIRAYNAGAGIEIQDDYSAIQGPCPNGYHIPSTTEWAGVKAITNSLSISDGWQQIRDLHLPKAGYRDSSNASTTWQGTQGYYWTYCPYGASRPYGAITLSIGSYAVYIDAYEDRARGHSIRAFKNNFEVPTANRTVIKGTLGDAGIFWNQTDGLISITSDGVTGYTIQDKNLGATTVFNYGDTLSEANCGYYYQRGNNNGFARTGSITTSSTQVDASSYGPGNYYSSNIFITGSNDWSSVHNDNLWGREVGVVTNVISVNADVWPNVKQFVLSGTSGATALAEAQEIFDWRVAGNAPVIKFQSSSGTYVLGDVDSNSITNNILTFYLTDIVPQSFTASGKSAFYKQYIVITVAGGSVTQIQSLSGDIGLKFLATDTDYATPYTPQYNGSPATKKYTDEHGPNIPVYYYLGDFNNDITFNIIEAGEYRLYVRAYHGTTVDKTLTLTVDSVTVGTLTSNLIEHLNASINFTASAGSTAVLSVSSKTNFTIQEVYIEKVNIQSGYLTATVN